MNRNPRSTSPTCREFFERVFRGKTCRPSRLMLPLALSLGGLMSGASAAPSTWDGDGADFFWWNALNWSGNILPSAVDDLTFGIVPTGTIHLGGSRTANSLTFNQNFTLGAYGTNLVLTDTAGIISVGSGVLGTINASYGGANGINLSGGGTLFLNHPAPLFAGNIAVDAGSTLLHRQEGVTPQYNGVGNSQEFARFDQTSLGFTTAVRTITLTNGGVYKIIGAGNNSENNFKNIVIGAGGGTLDLGAGYIVQNLDDTGQITATTEAFTKAGKGRLIITGTMATTNPLGGITNINGGMLSLDNQASQAVGANTYTRFVGIAGTGTTVNINNGGTLFLNNGTQATLDVPTINANNGSIIAVNGQDHIIGYSVAGGASSVTNLNISGSVNLPTRDLFNPQTQRFPRLRAALNGNGILNLLPSTNAGGNPRIVIERGVGSTFTGTFRLNENESLEANPRNNATVDVGKVIADGDIEFAGWGSTLDVRDSNATTSVFDYTTNEITITTPQAGAVNAISVNRATTATGTGSMFNFGTLTMGNHRLAITGANSFQAGFGDTASVKGDAVLIMNADAAFAVFSNASAIAEDAAGRSLTILKAGVGSTAARDVIVGGGISLSNLQVATGTLQLRGVNGAIGTGFGGAAPTITVNGSGIAGNGNTLPTAGLLHLDSNTGHVVGATTVFAAANHNNRIVDNATLNLRGNSTLRLTSASNIGTTETIGTTNIFGHGSVDLVKTGTATTPVALTLTTLNMGANATANFTGISLGTTGNNTSRIIIAPPGGTATGFMGAQFHSGNEWAKYDNTVDSGFELGVTPFVAGDYIVGSAETTWAAGQQIKQSGVTLPTLTANRIADRFNFQTSAANQPLNLAGFKLTADQGGIISSANLIGFKDGATPSVPSGTAGVTAGSTAAAASLFVHTTSTIEFHAPIIDNLAGGSVTFVKSGTGTVILSHQDRTVGQAGIAASPFTTGTWSSTNTGGWVINDGMLNVHRGRYLGATPTTVTLNGGQLEINEPVSNINDATIIPGWGHHIVVNGNAMIGADDNGESADANTGDRSLVKLGSLTVNNNSILGLATFSDIDIAFMGGATFNGKANLNIGMGGRSGINNANIISGGVAGSGFDVLALGGNGTTLVLGGTQTDTVSSTYSGQVAIYGSTVRLNKANGFTAITDGAATEDVVINGGNLFWGPGHHGDLTTTNQVGTTTVGAAIAGTNNYGLFGIAPTSPAAIKNAGMDQIADTASITLLTGTLGESDRITNEKWGTLIMKNGTLNVGLGTMEIDSATFSGGALGFDRGGTLKIGTASYLPGAFDQSVFTGRPGSPGAYTTLEIGAGGISLTGQNITLGNAFSGNVAGAGGRLKLGGNLTFVGSDLIGGSYSRKGIFVQTGSTFRELGASHIDLVGGVRDFNIDSDALFTITAVLTNGGITKSGGGGLALESYIPNTFTGAVTVNAGMLNARADGAFGTSAGGVTINTGATVKLESSWNYGDDFTVTGPGSIIPGSGSVREGGALIAEVGISRLNGALVLSGGATLAGNTILDPSAAPGVGGLAYRIGTLVVAGAGGVTGTGNLNLSGHGDGVILNGVNTTSGGLNKEGAGRWTLSGAGTYLGATTVSAGALRISNGAALGDVATGTSVYGGGSLELIGGITVAEPLTLGGDGTGSFQSGALVNVGGSNTITGPITLTGTTLRSNAGLLTVGSITGANTSLILNGAGDGAVNGIITLGPPTSGDVLTKGGTGTWTLSANNALTGSTAVNGGTLVLASAGNALHAASVLNMGGGNLNVTGGSQTVSGLNLVAGGGTVNGGASTTVNGITRSAGGTVNFAGSVLTSTGNVNGILGGYATYGSDWAVGGSTIAGFAGYVPLSLAAAANTDNSSISKGQLQTGNVTTNSLKIADGSGLLLGANNLVLTSGGLLFASSVPGGIGGTGTISGTTANDELIIHNTGARLAISAALIGAGTGGLTKAGNGELELFGTNAFTGAININRGTLSITNSASLGSTASPRDINLNGGTFAVIGSDYDLVANTLQLNVGPAGGTVRSLLGSQISINDGTTTGLTPTQLRGSGDLTFNGGGRYTLSGGTPQFAGFTGNTIVDGGLLTVGHSNALGGRQEQTLTLKSGSAIINNTGFAPGLNGLPNNIVSEGGVEFFPLAGNRAFGGDIQLSGTNTIALFERDTLNQERQIYFNGRVSGTGVTLNVFGANNGNPFYLASGSNPITGTINLNANAVMEVRGPGSLGVGTGDVTVNLNGANSRLFLRHWQNGDYRANVVVNDIAEINSDRLVAFAGGGLQILSINNLTFNGDNKILTIGGGNTYHTRVGGTMTLNAPTNSILNITGSDLILENGITFGTPGSTLDKRGGFTAILRGPTNHTGKLVIQGGLVLLQDGGTLASTTDIDLRGGELRVDNSAVVNTNRINDAATITLGGGALRFTGVETVGTITAVGGTTQIINNPISETVPNPLTLTGFTRQTGAVVQFQSPDTGAGALAVGQNTFAQTRVGSRIFVPGQANTTQTIPGFLGNNSLDFVQYDGTTIDSVFALGVRDMRNPGNVNSPQNYSNDVAETAWNDGIILRTSVASTTINLTASRALDAWKIEQTITTLNQGAFDLRIEGGGILAAAVAPVINGTTGRLYAGAAVATAGTAELFIGGNQALTINSIISNNPLSGQNVALVKTGSAATLTVSGANTYSGGTYVTAGTLNVLTNTALGAATNTITLSGGTLQLNIPNASSAVALGGLGQNINVLANSSIVLDNGALAGTDNDVAFGGITINGPYTLGLRSFDSMDASFTGTHTLSGNPTIDMAQAGSGGNGTGFFTISGAITGTSGFFISSSGNSNDTTSILQIGAGEAIANTYTGKVTILLGSNSEDLRVELNKATGTNAITGDLEINGGIVRNILADQIANTSNMFINQGSYDAFGLNETIASVTMRGGNFRTSSTGTGGSTVTVTGDFNATGLDDLTGSVDGVATNSNTTLTINGTLRLNGYSRGTVGGTASTLTVGALEMTGTTLSEAGAGSLIRLNGNVTTLASSNTARIGATTAAGAQVQLNGTRTFNVADGSAGLDLSVSSALTDSTSPVASGSLIKIGVGTMQFEGAALANAYTGTTAINEGTLVLFKNAGTNAIPAGALTIGDGIGGADADKVIVRLSNQISDASDVTLASSGLLDLFTFNTSEQVNSLGGAGNVDLGPDSLLTASGNTNATFTGSIRGAGGITKGGASIWVLTGINPYAGPTTVNSGTLLVDGSIAASAVTVNGGTLGGIGTVGDVSVNSSGTLAPGDSPGILSTGNLALNAGSTLLMELNNATAGSGYDEVNVTGTVGLAGTLAIALNFDPLDGVDTFALILNDGSDAVTGTFAGLANGDLFTVGIQQFQISYFDDASTPVFELSGGNDVSLIATVPEPGSLSLLLLGALGCLGFRQRPRQA